MRGWGTEMEEAGISTARRLGLIRRVRHVAFETGNGKLGLLNFQFPVSSFKLAAAAGIVLLAASLRADETADGRKLASELAQEGSHAAAAVEYRRLALDEKQPEARSGYFWAAAYEYHCLGDGDHAAKMLDRAEEASNALANESLLLRAESAIETRKSAEAAFYLEPIVAGRGAAGDMKRLAARRLSQAELIAKDPAGAKQALTRSPADEAAGMAAVDRYAQGHDKRPWVGGLLGMVPGLGYAYSGEFGNALRSLILNGLFIWGMVETGHDDQWGGFAAISFFEITWYTGSIYGGVDAAHRYNRDRLDACLDAVGGHSQFAPDRPQLPIVALRFQF